MESQREGAEGLSDPVMQPGLVEDLIKALTVIRDSGYTIGLVWDNIRDIRFMLPSESHLAYKVDYEKLGDSGYTIWLNPVYRDYATIERVEILLSALALAEDLPTTRLGCLGIQGCPSAATRWLHLNMAQPVHTLRVAVYEDRVTCVICHGRMASDTPIAQTPRGLHVHVQCNDFLHHVMIPQLKAQRAAAASA